jgi:hypothetical protein
MTYRASSARRLPAGIARAAVVSAPPAQRVPGTGRHSATEAPGIVRIATPEDLLRVGRHAAPEWDGRLPVHDRLRDELAAVDWFSLGTGEA